jgi:hypothetical protein
MTNREAKSTTVRHQHCATFLQMLTEAAARGEAVLTSQFAAISRNHTARISDLRADGHDIRCENAPTHLRVPGTGRQTQYRYIGNTREIAHEMFAVGHPLKSGPLVLRQYRNGSERGCLRLRPFATGGGISVLFDRPLSFLAGDTLAMSYVPV